MGSVYIVGNKSSESYILFFLYSITERDPKECFLMIQVFNLKKLQGICRLITTNHVQIRSILLDLILTWLITAVTVKVLQLL